MKMNITVENILTKLEEVPENEMITVRHLGEMLGIADRSDGSWGVLCTKVHSLYEEQRIQIAKQNNHLISSIKAQNDVEPFLQLHITISSKGLEFLNQRRMQGYVKQQVELIKEVGTSSRRLEKLTRILILFTLVIIATGLPIAVTTMMNLLNPNSAATTHPLAFAGIFIIIVALFIIGIFAVYPQDIKRMESNILGREAVATLEREEVHAGATISMTAHVEAHNPPQFTFEDYRAAIFLLIISIVFLWLSYQLQAVFPSSAGNVMGDLVIAMWILLGGSILILIIMVYRTFRH